MSVDVLTFMMGEFTAEFPRDLLYAKNHMWGKPSHEGIRFGFSAYAVRLLQDVYFLDWNIDPGTNLSHRQEMGAIESKKAESDLFAPLAGILLKFNEALLSDPSYINVDKYGEGWLFDLAGETTDLLTAEAYIEHLAAVWQVTQKTIKGQMH